MNHIKIVNTSSKTSENKFVVSPHVNGVNPIGKKTSSTWTRTVDVSYNGKVRKNIPVYDIEPWNIAEIDLSTKLMKALGCKHGDEVTVVFNLEIQEIIDSNCFVDPVSSDVTVIYK